MTAPPRPTDAQPPTAPIVPGTVHRVSIGPRDDRGRGVTTIGRRALRVANVLPGEVVDVRLTHVGRTTAEARVERVVEPSPDRIDDRCPHGTVCPGCGLRTTAEPARRALLRDRVSQALAREGLGDVDVRPTVPAPAADGWRHKAFLTARRTRRGIFLGLYEEHSHRLLGIEGCPAHAPAVERALGAARRALAAVDPPIYDERSREGWLRYVAVRAAGAEPAALVTLVATRREFAWEQALVDAIRRLAPQVVGIVLNVQDAPGNAPFGARFSTLAGTPHLTERSGPFTLRVSAGSFFQVNPAMGETLHDTVAAAARSAPAGRALDLYGGVGCTTLRLARDGRAVTLVESSPSAVEDARANATTAGLSDAIRILGDRVESIPIPTGAERPSVVIVNPPRSGLSVEVLSGLERAAPPLLLYVACDPRPLARDLARLRGAGATIESVVPFEMMPQTAHVEALAAVRLPS